LPAGLVEGEHELSAWALAQRMRGDEPFELADEVGVAAQGEVGLDSLLERAEAELLQPRCLGLSERLIGELVQRWAAPENQGVAQDPCSVLGPADGERLLAVRDQRFEAARVDRVRLDAEQVAGRAGDDQAVAERAAELRDGVLEHLRRGRRRPLAPEPVDQPIARHDLVGVQQEQREQRPLPSTRELDLSAFLDELQGPQDPELHLASSRPGDCPIPSGYRQ
jgi:hypothetical protein